MDIRLNVDKHNIGEMAELLELLHQRFGANEHLTVYSHELIGERSPEYWAFANDFDETGGGYIVVGVTEKNGGPIRPVFL